MFFSGLRYVLAVWLGLFSFALLIVFEACLNACPKHGLDFYFFMYVLAGLLAIPVAIVALPGFLVLRGAMIGLCLEGWLAFVLAGALLPPLSGLFVGVIDIAVSGRILGGTTYGMPDELIEAPVSMVVAGGLAGAFYRGLRALGSGPSGVSGSP